MRIQDNSSSRSNDAVQDRARSGARSQSFAEAFPFRWSRRHERCLVLGYDGDRLRAAIVSRGIKQGVIVEARGHLAVNGDISAETREILKILGGCRLPGAVVVATHEAQSHLLELPYSASQWTDS